MSHGRSTLHSPRSIAVTGASGGLGAALALAYAAPGVMLALAGRDVLRLEAAAEACRRRGAEVQIAAFDITSRERSRDWIESADDRCTLDLVVANAAISSSIGMNGEPESAAAVERIFAVNVGGVINVVTPALERMLSRRHGQIALVGSLAGLCHLPCCPAYSASKAAVHHYGAALRSWLAPQGVNVSVICPGFVATPMSDRVIGPKPFLVPAERAAITIRGGLERNRAVIGFPFPLYIGARLLPLLPDSLYRLLMRYFEFRVQPTPELAVPLTVDARQIP